MKLIMSTLPVHQKCKLCDKIDTKKRRADQERDRIHRWIREGGKPASVEKSKVAIKSLEFEIDDLKSERQKRVVMLGGR